MKLRSKKLSVILLSISLLGAQQSFAARVGKSKSLGMQRSTTSQRTYNNSSNYQRPATPQQQPQGQPQRKGPGVGAVVAGAAAGAVGGYMLGKAMNSNEAKDNASQPVSTAAAVAEPASTGNNIPWGIIAILGLLLLIGLSFFRKRASAPQTNPNAFGNSNPNTNNFEIPTIQKTSANMDNANSTAAPSSEPVIAANERMSDGVEAQYFLRQAKGMFLHIQSMNTPDNVNEVAKYMTPELYQEIKQLITENDYVADFSQLDCQLLDSTIENGLHIATVKFFGKVSESPTQPAVDFAEIWNFVKPVTTEGGKWLVAGIQQVAEAN